MYRQLAVAVTGGNLQPQSMGLLVAEGCPGALFVADMIGMVDPQPLLDPRPEQAPVDEEHTVAEVRKRSMALHIVDKYIGLDKKALMAIQADMHLLGMVHLRAGMAVAVCKVETGDCCKVLALGHAQGADSFRAEVALAQTRTAVPVA